MPFKHRRFYPRRSKHPYQAPQRNWSHYNKQMKQRVDIAIWLSQDVIDQWYVEDRTYAGDGAPRLYSDMAITTIHEIRQVFRLPLRQCEGFVNALFKLLDLGLCYPIKTIKNLRAQATALSLRPS